MPSVHCAIGDNPKIHEINFVEGKSWVVRDFFYIMICLNGPRVRISEVETTDDFQISIQGEIIPFEAPVDQYIHHGDQLVVRKRPAE